MARAMKDSGLEWAGVIPAEWTTNKGKYFMQLLARPVDENDGVITCFRDGEVTLRSNRREEGFTFATVEAGYQGIEPGDLVVHGMDGFAGAIGISDSRGKGTPALNVLDCSENKKYIMYLLRTMAHTELFMALATGIRVRTCDTSWKKLRELDYIIPPTTEQERIVAFIEKQCTEIDALMADVQAQIETLEQYKRSVITEAVTKGLNPTIPLKDGGTDWIGQIPIHWNISKIKYEISPIERAVYETDGIITCFRNGEVTLRSNRREEGFTISLTEHGYHGVDVGDLVIHGMDAFAGAIGCSDSRGKITPVVHVCRTTGNNRFFMYFLRSMAYGDILMDLSDGVRVRSSDYRNFSKLGKLSICVPPLDEQDKIVDYLDSKVKQIDDVITQKQEQLDILEEYKKSVIFEYVTGKKEVPVA